MNTQNTQTESRHATVPPEQTNASWRRHGRQDKREAGSSRYFAKKHAVTSRPNALDLALHAGQETKSAGSKHSMQSLLNYLADAICWLAVFVLLTWIYWLILEEAAR